VFVRSLKLSDACGRHVLHGLKYDNGHGCLANIHEIKFQRAVPKHEAVKAVSETCKRLATLHAHTVKQLSHDKYLADFKMHKLRIMSLAACACAVLWGPGGDAHSIPAGPAWLAQWLPSVSTSAQAAWAVAHYFSRTCEQSQCWCMTKSLALQCDDVLMCCCTHSSYLMHSAEMCCMTLVTDIEQSILQLSQCIFKPNAQVHTCAGSE